MASATSILVACAMGLVAASVKAAGLTEAQLTQIVKDVQLLPPSSAPKAAGLRDAVRNGTAVKTGQESRAELTFEDLTITRLGANTIFSFNEGTRHLDLGGGAVLLHVPKDAGGATITTAAITAGITGTTVLLEVHRNNNSKAIVLEGVMRVALSDDPSESRNLHAGEMIVVPPHSRKMPASVKVRLKTLVGSSPMITEFPVLASEPLIAEEIAKQEAELEGGPGTDEENPPMEIVDQRFAIPLEAGGGAGAAAPKFGALKTITNPNPYVIDAGTTIQTDPTITTNGVKDFGRIYRDQTNDGTPANYFFGSSSTFDADSEFNGIAEVPTPSLATFKFTALQLAGSPTISLGSGGPAKLALISEGPITTGGAGATLTFANADFVLLATQAAGINLGANVAFSSIPGLEIYARGAGSGLVISSPMTAIGQLNLLAEASIRVNSNIDTDAFATVSQNYLTAPGVVTVGSFISMKAFGTVNFAMDKLVIGSGGSIVVRAPIINVDASVNPGGFTNAVGVMLQAADTLAFTGATTVTLGTNTSANWSAGAGGLQAPNTSFSTTGGIYDISASGNVTVNSLLGGGIINTSGSIKSNGDLIGNFFTAGTDITVGGNLGFGQRVLAGGNIDVTGNLGGTEVEVTGNLTAQRLNVLIINGDFTTSTTILTAGTGGIRPHIFSQGNGHDYTVETVISNTAPIGLDFGGNFYAAPGSPGAALQLNVDTQIFSNGVNGIRIANFDGKDDLFAPDGTTPGSGGAFILKAQGATTLDQGVITATSGMIDTNTPQPVGNGGTVSIITAGELDVINNSRIQVSSADPLGSANRRSSAQGGDITLQSDVVNNVAIQVDSSSQLLSLLENAAPGPGGKIVLRATGATSSIQAGGTMRADKGAVDIRHSGDAGLITVNTANLSSDFTKIAVLGNNGHLTIGTGNTISGNTILKLYAEGSSGVLEFAGNVTLNSPNAILAAKTINVNNGVTVTINGANPAKVFTDNPNYQGFGGTGGALTGTFAGTAAPSNPLPFNDPGKPALGPVGGL